MKTFAFKNRLFISYAIMTVALILLFAVLLLSFTASLNRETELIHQREIFEGNLTQVESFLIQANRVAMQVASNNEILSCFILLDEPGNIDGGGGNYFDDNLLDAIRMSSLLEDINGVDAFADRISVFNRYGDYVSAGRLYETPERIRDSLGEVFTIDAVTDEVMEHEDHCLVLGFHRDTWSNNPNTSFITLYRTLSYTDTSTPYGLVGVQLNSERLNNLSFWGEGGNGEYFMINDRHPDEPELLYTAGGDIALEALYPALAAQLNQALAEGQSVAQLPYKLNGHNVIMLVSRPMPSNWLFVRAIPAGALSRPYMRIYSFMILGCLVLLAFLLLVINYMAERISRPLRTLSASISGISLKNMHLPRQQYSTRELAALDEAFRAMLDRLDKTIEVEMQAYMRVLQSQMNPHFLYNMLSVIIASSESAGDERTVSMCLKLTSMLRYVADIRREYVKLSDEVAHTKNYLDLMKERYEDLFTYEIEVSDGAMDVLLPRLTIQPLTENCFMHGFKNEPPWTIRVSVRVSQDRWQLRVEDNGVGMTDAEVADLESRLKAYRSDVAGSYQELTLGGMGLINTLLRLMLMYNGPVEYRIKNRPIGGLIIQIGGPVYDSCADSRG